MLESGLPQVVGRRITAVLVKKGVAPEWQVHLLLDDGVWYELYGNGYLGGSSDLHEGDLATVQGYMGATHKTVLAVAVDELVVGGVDVN